MRIEKRKRARQGQNINTAKNGKGLSKRKYAYDTF